MQQWKEAQSRPDDLTLLKMYKRGGVEPIKLAKYISSDPFTAGL